MWVRGLVSLCAVIGSLVSQVYADTCDGRLGKDRFRIRITESRDVFSTTVTINGKRVPRLGACWAEDRPSTRHIRCTHRAGDLRVEVYPWAETTSGKIIGPRAVVWRGKYPTYMPMDCD